LKKKAASPAKNKNGKWWLVLGGVAVFAAVLWFSGRNEEPTPPQAAVQTASAQTPAVKSATLSPDLFTGRVREAYQAARDVPEVLKQVQCYCGCKRTAGHQSNFDCFTDEHGFG
jgi:hypothetical protein